MLKWLLKSLLILAVFVPFATALPVAALWLCPDGNRLPNHLAKTLGVFITGRSRLAHPNLLPADCRHA